MSRDVGIATAIGAAALATGLLFTVDVHGQVRAFVAIAFLLVGPGLALVRLLRFRDPLTELTLAVTLSLGLETLIATALLANGRWSPGMALTIVIVVTMVGVFLDIAQIRGQEASPRRDTSERQPHVQGLVAPTGEVGSSE